MEEKNKKFGGASNRRFNYQGKRMPRNNRTSEIRTFIADEGKTPTTSNEASNGTQANAEAPRERRVIPRQHDRRENHGVGAHPHSNSNGNSSGHSHSHTNNNHRNRKSMMISSKTPRLPQQKFETQPKDSSASNKKSTKQIPPPLGDTIRIIPLGGVEEIGRNMTVIEYKNDIVVIDAGLQFSEDDTPGIDYILPNTKYLEERKGKIRAMIVTHGHLDHIGGIPYIMDRIGNPPLYTRKLTGLMIEKRQYEFPDKPKLDIRVVEKDESIKLGELDIKFFSVTHTIPDSMGIIINTPYGMVITPGDFKLSHTDGVVDQREEDEYGIFDKEKVLMLIAESTNIENPGFSTPERLVHKTLEDIVTKVNTRLIVGTFSSQFERMIKIIQVAESVGKKIVVEGRSMKTNIDVAVAAGIFTPKKDTIIPTEDVDKYPPNKIVVLATGAQGEEFAALMRMANKSHRSFHVKAGDTVVLSSSIIPGNERTVQKLKDNLARAGAKILHYRTSDLYVHSTGHANRGEIEWLHRKLKPKFFMPIHGTHYMLRQHEELAQSVGMPPQNIVVPDNGTIVEIREKEKKLPQ